MKNTFKHILSAAALFMLTATAAFAEGDDNKGIVATKKVTATENGYTLTLETYAEGEGSATTTTVSQPLDIVLVLDMSGSMDDDFSDKKQYIARSSQTYSYTDLRNKTYYYLDNGVYYKVTRANDNSSWGWPTDCYIYYTKDNQKYYLYGDSVSTAKTTVSSNYTGIWTGILYENRNPTKLDALKESVTSFIDEVELESTLDATHNIAIVTFAGSGSSKNVSNGLVSDFDRLREIVADLTANGGTFPGEAMEKANTILNGVPATRKSSKLVVMFTDGVPAGSNGDPNNKFSDDNKAEANNTIAKSKTLKSNNTSYVLNSDGTYTAVGITVFSVGIFTNEFSDITNYMSYVSSNYPNAESMDKPGIAGTEQVYSFTASSAEALNDIFNSIAQTATSGAGSTSYTKENSDVRDFITPQFKLAEGQGVSAITVEYVPCKTDNRTTSVIWLDPVSGASKGITAEAGTKGEDGITPVIIKGYDFKENWVGAYMEGTQAKSWHAGGKLVITINIELDPKYEAAGVVSTNTDDSGIYYKDDKEVSFTVTDITFPVPQTVNKDFAYLCISKAGLVNDENAIFDVKSGSQTVAVVMLNAANPQATLKVDWLTADVKSKTFDSENPLTAADMLQFTVVERADWSWNAPSTVDAKPLYKLENGLWVENNVFSFTSGEAKTEVSYDEKSVVKTK